MLKIDCRILFLQKNNVLIKVSYFIDEHLQQGNGVVDVSVRVQARDMMKQMIINSYTNISFLSFLFCVVIVLEHKIYLNNKNVHK
jgi:hypothetical protein